MSISKSNRDQPNRWKSTTCLVAATTVALVGHVLGVGCPRAVGQTSFAPPPSPSPVRGIYDPAQTNSSPALVTPPPAASASNDVVETTPITPTKNTDAKPIAGGEIVARVDGQIVLASDVLWQVNQIIQANLDRIPPKEIDKARRALLRQQVMGLIDTKLLYADFRRNIPPENIPKIAENLAEPFDENEIPRLIKVLELKNRLELAERLESFGSSLADVQRQFNERTIAGEWLRQKAPKPKQATHDQMLEYYQAHLTDYDFPAQVKWEEIMVRFSRFDNDRAAAWREIAGHGNTIWQQVAKHPGLRGPVFTEIAKQKSHGFTADKGGQHDWTTKGALRSEAINEALFVLDVGQLSNILESDIGFHILRVLERKTAGRTPFTVAQAEIRKQLEGGRTQKLVQRELKKLRKQSRVWTVFDGDLSGPKLAELMDRRRR